MANGFTSQYFLTEWTEDLDEANADFDRICITLEATEEM